MGFPRYFPSPPIENKRFVAHNWGNEKGAPKMWDLKQLDGDAIRDSIDARDRFIAQRAAKKQHAHSFSGSMFYDRISGNEYLIRLAQVKPETKVRRRNSLGPRSAQSDQILAQFKEDKTRLKDRIKSLEGDLRKRSRILVARGLGRIPTEIARIMRKLDTAGLLGVRLHVVGTNALYAYEAAAGVHINSGLIATGDLDVLHDIRQKISLAAPDVDPQGLIGLLRQVDKSFAPEQPNSFRAVNDKGFLVDLIEPITGNPMLQEAGRLSDSPDDIRAVAIEGLNWLINAPKFEAIAIDTRGMPTWIPTIDPRAFALHKLWLSKQPSRDANKKRRDHDQAIIAAQIAENFLGLDFDAGDLSALPAELLQGLTDVRPLLGDLRARLDR
jgi:hypothetical protein